MLLLFICRGDFTVIQVMYLFCTVHWPFVLANCLMLVPESAVLVYAVGQELTFNRDEVLTFPVQVTTYFVIALPE